MKKLRVFTEDMASYDTIKEWQYRFSRLSWVFLLLFLAAAAICVTVQIKYESSVSDNNEIVNYISQSSDMPCTGNLEALIGKYHISPNKRMPDSTVYEVIKECGAWYPEVIMAQYIIESGSGTSTLAKHSNNLFGMRTAQRRPTTQLSGVSNSGYGVYLNREHSIIDRVLWERWIFKNEKPTYEAYMNKIGAIYAEAPDYREKLERTAINCRKYNHE